MVCDRPWKSDNHPWFVNIPSDGGWPLYRSWVTILRMVCDHTFGWRVTIPRMVGNQLCLSVPKAKLEGIFGSSKKNEFWPYSGYKKDRFKYLFDLEILMRFPKNWGKIARFYQLLRLTMIGPSLLVTMVPQACLPCPRLFSCLWQSLGRLVIHILDG